MSSSYYVLYLISHLPDVRLSWVQPLHNSHSHLRLLPLQAIGSTDIEGTPGIAASRCEQTFGRSTASDCSSLV